MCRLAVTPVTEGPVWFILPVPLHEDSRKKVTQLIASLMTALLERLFAPR